MKHSDIQALASGVAPVVRELIERHTAPLLEESKALVSRLEALEKQLGSLPAARDGKDGHDGKSVSVDDVLPALQDQVAKFLETIPMPKDGKDGVDGAPGKDGEPGEKGADGVGLAGAMIDRTGQLVITLTNGATKELGVIVGKDGEDGKDGKDGADGLGLEDLTFELSETGRAVAKFQRGEVVKAVKLPSIVDRGIFREGETYEKGDAVTWGGSLWIAQEDGVTEKPEATKAWRLAVKKGRDGKDTEAKKVL